MNESDLLKAFEKDWSEEAFADLVRRYAGLVYSVAKRRVADASLAEDITQLVFIRFAKAPPRVSGHAQLAAWLHRTTLNVAIDTWRSESRRREREQKAFTMESATTETAVWNEIVPKLDEALNQLNDDDRQALLLRFFGRKTMREVGLALGVSEDAAKMRVSRAVGRLRTQLQASGAVCTAAGLGTLLEENSVEAAPSQLVSRLASLRLPAAASAFGRPGVLEALSRATVFKRVLGVIVLPLIVAGIVELVRPSRAPISKMPASAAAQAAGETNKKADWRSLVSVNSRAHAKTPGKPVMMLFHVVDSETGDGLGGTQIHAAFFGAGGMGETHDELTDDTGTSHIPEPEDATKTNGINVFVVAEGHVPKAVSFSRNGIPSEYTMKLDPAVTAGGVVVNGAGLPVAGVKIGIQAPGIKPGQAENVDFQMCSITSSENGSWSCSYIPRDYTNEIHFLLNKSGYAPTDVAVPVAQVDLTNLAFVIDRGFTITGQITDSENRPIFNALVKTLSSDMEHRQTTKTDESGAYELDGVPDDVTGPEWSFEHPGLTTNINGAVVIRAARSFFSGFHEYRLETNGGAALIVKHSMPWPGEMKYPQVKLAVQAEGFSARTAVVELRQTTNVFNLKFTLGSIFRGRVVDETGRPIPNAVVRTDWDSKGHNPASFDWSTSTDETGRFEWKSAPAEEISYWFEAGGYRVIRSMPFLADGSDHEITLKRNAAN